MTIVEKLKKHSQSNYISFHMPGHKSKSLFYCPSITDDITELYGMDDLQHPKEMIKDAMDLATAIYGSKSSLICTNGSTASNMAAINSVTTYGSTILVCGNPHRSLYNIAELKNLRLIEIAAPKLLNDYEIQGQVVPDDVKAAIKQNKEIKAVFITSPTYEGIVSDIKEISKTAHSYDIPLIVDEAHGSHLALSKHFSDSAIQCGADIVINSLHKNLPALTSSSMLHIGKESLIDSQRLFESLLLFQTTSPSYLLLASIDSALHLIRNDGNRLFNELNDNLKGFYDATKGLEKIHILDINKDIHDKSRIVAMTKAISAEMLYSILREEYHIEMERIEKEHIIGISTIADSFDDIKALSNALINIDKEIKNGKYHA